MYSNTVYLFAENYIPQAKALEYKEELYTGTKVAQKKLANEAVLAAIIYLKEKGFIDLELKENKILFIKTVNATAKKLKEDDGKLSGLEKQILNVVREDIKIKEIIWNLLQTSYNPWEDIVSIVKNDLTEKGVIERQEKGKVLFIKTFKTGLANNIPAEENEKKLEYEKMISEFRQNKELYEKVYKGIEAGIASRVTVDHDDKFSD